jgi:hypothetical protein
VHYGADYEPTIDWEKAKRELEYMNDDSELVTLEETKFRVFEQ